MIQIFSNYKRCPIHGIVEQGILLPDGLGVITLSCGTVTNADFKREAS